MHDAIFFEEQGIPTATVATKEFARAARAQAEALGQPFYRVVLIPHPVQILTPEEVRARADAAFEEIVARLIAP